MTISDKSQGKLVSKNKDYASDPIMRV